MKRVVITGMGVISPVGNSIEEYWNALKMGKHGFDYISYFDIEDFPVKIAAEVKNFEPLKVLSNKEVKRKDLFTQYALVATEQALQDAKVDMEKENPYRIGTIVGTGIGGIHTIEEELQRFQERGHRFISPISTPKFISNMASGEVAIRYGLKGDNYSVTSACASSSHAIGDAYSAIKLGRLDMCVAGGTEAAVTKFSLSCFDSMKTLSHSDNPDRASIPFDKERCGFVMGEGAGILILEELEHAKARNAKIYAEVVGYGATADAYHITSPIPNGEASSMAIINACREAEISPEAIDYFNAHGTSTVLNDNYETKAVKLAFGKYAKDLLISSTKSMTGHLLGAAGAIEAIACVMAIKDSFVPMTVGYKVPDEECDLNYVTDKGIEQEVNYAISNSLGFGGHNAALCFKKYEE